MPSATGAACHVHCGACLNGRAHSSGEGPGRRATSILHRTTYTGPAPPILLLFVDDLVVCFDDIIGLRARAAGRATRRWFLAGVAGRWTRRPTRCPLLLVERLSSLTVGTGELFLGGANLRLVVRAQGLACPFDSPIELRLEIGTQPVGPFLGVLLHLVRHAVEAVPGVDFLAPLLVLRRVLVGILDHPV